VALLAIVSYDHSSLSYCSWNWEWKGRPQWSCWCLLPVLTTKRNKTTWRGTRNDR
jgi:hypothetical protein